MDFSCLICNKNYKSYQSYWNHKKKFHSDENNNYVDTKQRNFSCSKCNKKFTRKDSLNYHITNTCKNKNADDKITKLEKQVAELQKIVSQTKISTTNNINNGTINNINNINNIVYINKTGTENLLELTEQETKEIFSKEISGVVSLIKFINFNERIPSNHSFCTKSLEGKYLLKYNTEESKIESTRKKYFYHELLSTAVDKMELLYKVCKNKFSKDKQQKIEDTIFRLKDIKDRDFSDKILKEIQNQLIQLSYNCRNIVLNTWENNKIEGKIIDNSLELLDDLFIDDNNSSDSDSDDSDIPKLVRKKKNTEIEI